MNPYLELGVPRDADDQRIRRAYLEAIKEATPETDPDRFKTLTDAYNKIKDETARYRYELFHTDSPGASPLDLFLRHARLRAKPAPLPFEAMKEYLRSCSKM
jgi:curved DNA-binding protein CbpA